MSILIYILGIIASNTAGVMLFDRNGKLNAQNVLFLILISLFSWTAYIAIQLFDFADYLGKKRHEKNNK